MNCRLPVLREKTAKLTTSPGVYLMKAESGKIREEDLPRCCIRILHFLQCGCSSA